MNEVEKFLEDTNPKVDVVDVLDQPLVPDDLAKVEGEQVVDANANDSQDDGDDSKPRNRRERRLMQRLEDEKQSSAFLAGKLSARSDAEKAVSEEADYLKAVEQIYGNDTPEKQLATDLLKKAITGARDDAERRAYERLISERENESRSEAQANDELDTMIDELEDEHGVTLTPAQEKGFFQLLQKMSPKDSDGNVKEYADPAAVWEVFAERLQKRGGDNRAKDMSSRSMTQSGAARESNLTNDVTARFLNDNGII